MSRSENHTSGKIRVDNIGGIDSAAVTFSPGITILSGRNATNRTSLLQAFRAGLGSENVSLKGDAETGRVELDIGGNTYIRQLEKAGNGISFSGDPYLEDTEEADLFAFLLEDNEARKAVIQQDDLREIIMRPVDTAAIQSQIENYREEKQQLKNELNELDTLKSELPSLEERKRTLEQQIEEKEDALQRKKQEIADADADIAESKAQKREREETLEKLQEARSDLETNRRRINSEQESISALENEMGSIRDDYESLELPDENPDSLDREISTLRERKRSLESKRNQLQQIIQFNSDMLDEETEMLESLTSTGTRASDGGALTEQLLEDETETVCWTCGSAVSSDRINETLNQLRSMHKEMVGERNELSDRIDDLQKERKEISRKQRQKETYEEKIENITEEIERRERTLETLREKREELEATVAEHEQRVNEFEENAYDDLLALQKELTTLEFDLSSLQSEREDVIDEIESIESRLSEEEDLLEHREEVTDTLADLRTKIDDLERESVESFNEHMNTVLDVLEYENIERIWIERVQQTVRNGRRKEQQSTFEMHIVRETEDGKSYEDTINHLSESEREVTGLVFALAGFLVHDIHEELPVMLLDSLEALDSNRIAALVEYFSEYVDYLFVALLPEDAQALPTDCNRITNI